MGGMLSYIEYVQQYFVEMQIIIFYNMMQYGLYRKQYKYDVTLLHFAYVYYLHTDKVLS